MTMHCCIHLHIMNSAYKSLLQNSVAFNLRKPHHLTQWCQTPKACTEVFPLIQVLLYTNTIQSFTLSSLLCYALETGCKIVAGKLKTLSYLEPWPWHKPSHMEYAMSACPRATHRSFNGEWGIFMFPKYSNSVLLPPFASKTEKYIPHRTWKFSAWINSLIRPVRVVRIFILRYKKTQPNKT